MPQKRAEVKRREESPVLANAIDVAAKPLLEHFKGRQPGERLTERQEEALLTLLAMTGGTMTDVSRMTGVSISEVFSTKHKNLAAFEERRATFKKAAALESHEVFIEATAQVRAMLPEAGARDAAVVAGIFAEKGMLFAGDAITVNHVHSVNEGQLTAAVERLRAIRPAEQPETMDAEFKVVE